MSLIRLERPVHYGNAGFAFNELRPVDDPYIFTPENTQDVMTACRNITERYGYDFREDVSGDFILRPRNNPHVVLDIEPGDIAGSLLTHPNAYGGTYIATSSNANFTVTAARIDLVCPRGPSLGVITFTVHRVSDNVLVASGAIDAEEPTAPATGIHYYDFRTDPTGANATVVTLYSNWYDEYRVGLTANGGTIWLDCFQLWHTDPMRPLLPNSLKTEQNAISVATRSVADELRNFVTVVGRRRAVVTDSDKLDTNPQNPNNEFIVSRAVALASVVNPEDPQFYGGVKETIIYDAGITDEDFADYLARVFIYRYRNPRPSAPITHTFLPAIQLRDPVFAEENAYGSLQAGPVLWVTSITHRIEGNRATTELDTSSLTEFPSYEVREDIDVDRLFNGQPVINVACDYVSLTGHAKHNLGSAPGTVRISQSIPAPVGDIVTVEDVAIGGGTISMAGHPWPPVPGTMFIKPGPGTTTLEGAEIPRTDALNNEVLGVAELAGVVGIVGVQIKAWNTGSITSPTPPTLSDSWTITNDRLTSRQFFWELKGTTLWVYRSGVGTPSVHQSFSATVLWTKGAGYGNQWLGNTPYHRFTETNYAGRSVAVSWDQGDPSAPYQRNFSTCSLRYRAMRGDQTTLSNTYPSGSPFYDPYTSEVGNLVQLSFDALVTGLYRISVRSYYDDTIVAWLTTPTADAQNDEAHWAYITAGAGRSFAWDGVDQVGTWNQRQSQFYAQAAHGAFDVAEKPVVGAGFYAWNNEEHMSDGGSRLAVIADTQASGKPVFGQGTFAEWYFCFEVKNDRLQERYEDAVANNEAVKPYTEESGRVVHTGSKSNRLNQSATGNPSQSYEAKVYTHLPEATRCAISISDWRPGTRYTPDDANIAANWQNTPDTDATINNSKPVRMRFTVQPRPGVLWDGHQGDVSVKLTRHVHLRRNVMDQFIKFSGTNYPGQDVEARTIVSRRATNDDHTLTFVDDHYRSAESFRQSDGETGTEWIFRPDDFRKDFRGVPNEALVFGDYLQLEEVPFWDTDQAIGGARSRFQIAFLQDLFYLSAYVQDRSGRYSWCINPSFVDRSKITYNSQGTTWPDDPMHQHRRTIFVRQWTDERLRASTGAELLYRDWMVDRWGDTTSIRNLSRHYWHNHGPGGAPTWGGFTDDYLLWDVQNGRMPATYSGFTSRQLGKANSTALGQWQWETGPSFPPNVTRDFHGFYVVPPMVDKQPSDVTGLNYHDAFIYVQVDSRSYTASGEFRNSGDDVGGLPTWHSPINDDTAAFGSDLKRFRQSRVVTPDKDPTRVIQSNTLDYLRQDSMVHYENLRGIYSRGPRPSEAPKKVTAGLPYYQNLYQYDGVSVGRALDQQGLYPLYKAEVLNWFTFTFRHEYLWESDRMFPCTQWGKERLDAVNKEKARVHGPLKDVRYDPGAWTGFKDDAPGSRILIGPESTANADRGTGQIGGVRVFKGPDNIFLTNYLPWAVGPKLPETKNAVFHLVLLDERRSNPAL